MKFMADKKQLDNINGNSPWQIKNNLSLEEKKRSRDAGVNIVKLIEAIIDLRSKHLDSGVRQNMEDKIIVDIYKYAKKLHDRMKINIFGTTNITLEIVTSKIDEIIINSLHTNVLEYIRNAEEGITRMEKWTLKNKMRKARALYKLSPKRAMRYYVNIKDTPSCQLDMNMIKEELTHRWDEKDFNPSTEEKEEWRCEYKLSDEDREFIISNMGNAEAFKNVIKTRDITSAHGPDGLGYWLLKLQPELGSNMMTLISNLMMKYKFIPTAWARSKTILIYKKGDEQDLRNWRPLSIASCLYRTWVCVLEESLQSSNRTGHIFNSNQKGFIKGVDGGLEHSNMITELLCDANRSRRDIYITTIDLRDAFGSIPHKLITKTLNDLQMSEEITEIIKESYSIGVTKVYKGDERSEDIRVKRGVKQGCPLSHLVFNLCLNPLLCKLDEEGNGYRVNKDIHLTVQAYADDIVIFAESRDGMIRNLRIIEEFTKYSKLEINVDKCHSMAYIYREGKRYYEEQQFILCNRPIKVSTLADSIKYLGMDTATTAKIRKKGTEKVIQETESLIGKICESLLSLNQKNSCH